MKTTKLMMVLLLLSQIAFTQKAITVEKSGKGKPILFLPGFTAPGSVWNETIKGLEGSFASYTVSYAGFNGLTPIDTPWYEAIEKQLVEYIQNERMHDVVIIGHSMGGILAIDIASALPDRVAGLVLVESIPFMLDLVMPGVPISAIQYNSPYNNQLLQMPDDKFREMAIVSSQNMTNVQSKVDVLTNWSVIADRKTYVYGYTDLLKLDVRDKLSNIQIHSLILGASFPSKEIEKANLEKQYVNLKNKEIYNADNSKHFIMFDQPEWLCAHINKYLKQYAR